MIFTRARIRGIESVAYRPGTAAQVIRTKASEERADR